MEFMSSKKILQYIRARMNALSITPKQIAQHIVRSEDFVNDCLNGKQVINYRDLLSVCDLLSIDTLDIMHKNQTK